jgi:glycosyltransferase involved in cell wall biosynthesis
MAKLSVIVITNNEEKNLPRMLASVSFADEFIVNDSGSADRTLEFAKLHDCRIIHSEFVGFGAAKQAALETATNDWVLSIDADEEVDEELKNAIVAAIETNDFDGFLIKRKSQFLGRWILHSGWYPDRIIRLFRRSKGRFTGDSVHERVEVDGRIGRLEGHLLHYTDPDIEHYLNKLNRYTTLSAGILQNQGRRFRVSNVIVKPPATFIKMYFLKSGYRDGIPGLLLALLSSFHVLCKYAKLWERQK